MNRFHTCNLDTKPNEINWSMDFPCSEREFDVQWNQLDEDFEEEHELRNFLIH